MKTSIIKKQETIENDEVDNKSGEQDNAEVGGVTQQKKKQSKRKKTKRSFDLVGITNLKLKDYNALNDKHLQSYFSNCGVRKLLKEQFLITKRGFIITDTKQYVKNDMEFKEPFQSSSCPKMFKQKKLKNYDQMVYQVRNKVKESFRKDTRVSKGDQKNFVDSVQKQYDIDG